jgi:hypothetical protein
MDNNTTLHRLRAVAAALTTACTQYASLLMAQTIETTETKRTWDDDELNSFIDYLYEHRSEAGEGGFKASTFNNAAIHIAALRVVGPPKEGKHCRSKFNAVHLFNIIEMNDKN